MVGTYVPFENLYVVGFANLADQFSKSLPYLASQDRFAIFWDKHKVVVTLIDGVRTMTILLHDIPKYRKPPEGVALRRGGSPIPGGDPKLQRPQKRDPFVANSEIQS